MVRPVVTGGIKFEVLGVMELVTACTVATVTGEGVMPLALEIESVM